VKTVVGIVNFIRALNHRRLQDHVDAFDAEHGDVQFHNSVRWFSHGAVLERFVALFPHTFSFRQRENILHVPFTSEVCGADEEAAKQVLVGV